MKFFLVGLKTSLCTEVLRFLTGRQHTVNFISKLAHHYIGISQGCVLGPLLFTLLTCECTVTFCTNQLIRFIKYTKQSDLFGICHVSDMGEQNVFQTNLIKYNKE